VTGPFPALIPLPGGVQRSPDPLAGLKGVYTSKERKGWEGKGRGEKRARV